MSEHNQIHLELDRRRNFSDHSDSSLLKVTEVTKKRQRWLGQVVVEYVFLLIFAVMIASLAVKGCVKRSEDEPGSVIVYWDGLLKTIGKDLSDEPNPNSP
jgi:hypothetical protein